MSKVRIEPATDPKYPDKMTEDIAKGLEAEGKDLSSFKQPEPPEPSNEDDEEDKKSDEASPEKKEEEKVEAKDEDKQDEKKDDVEEKKPRQVLIPIVRFKQREKELKRELEAQFSTQITDLKNQIETLTKTGINKEQVNDKVAELTAKATEIATKHGADLDLVKDILASVQSLSNAGTTIPDELKEAVDIIKTNAAETKKEREEVAERQETEGILNQYEDEFSKSFTGSTDEAKAMAGEIRKSGLSTEEFKERLQNLVLGEDGEKYAKLSLVEVYQLKKVDLLPKKAKSAEAPNGRVSSGVSDTGDDNRMPSVEEQEEMVKNGTFMQFSDRLGKNSRSRITRGGQSV